MYLFIDKKRRMHSFELFGYDFMIDEDFKVYLIEANINPCLSASSSFSTRFITGLVDNTLRIAIDPLFPPPPEFAAKRSSLEILPEMKYELIFDQRVDGQEIERLYTAASTSTPHTTLRRAGRSVGQRGGNDGGRLSRERNGVATH